MPKQLLVIIMLSVLLVSNIFCENNGYYLEIDFPSYQKKQISIGSYYGKNLLLEGNIHLDSEGKALYKNIVHKGIYVLLLPDSSSYEFMITDPGKYRFSMLEQRINISANPSAEAYRLFFDLANNTKLKIDSLESRSSVEILEEKQLLKLKIKEEKSALDSLTRYISQEFEGNLVGDYCKALLPVKMPESSSVMDDSLSWFESINYYRNHFLDNINWNNKDLIYTQILEEKILTYIEKIVSQNSEGITQAIDTLFSKVEGDNMIKFTANTLLSKFQKSIQKPLSEYAFVYLITEYILEDRVPDISPQVKIKLSQKADRIQPSMIGEKATIFSLNEEDGDLFTLNKNNSLTTILFFWDYSCPSCTRILKSFRQVLNEYHQENIKVITIFTGEDEAIWQAWVHKHLNQNWANTNLSEKTEILKIYNITHTPTIYLLDADLTIVDKNITVQELDKFLNKIAEAKR